MMNKTIGKIPSALASEMDSTVRRVSEFVAILTATTSQLTPYERKGLVVKLRDDVQLAHRLLDVLGNDYLLDAGACALDEALRALNANGVFGSISQVRLCVI